MPSRFCFRCDGPSSVRAVWERALASLDLALFAVHRANLDRAASLVDELAFRFQGEPGLVFAVQALADQDNMVRDRLTGTSMWACTIPVATPCAGGTFNYGPGSGGQDTCSRDPMTGVCPASCFSCGGGAGGGGMRV